MWVPVSISVYCYSGIYTLLFKLNTFQLYIVIVDVRIAYHLGCCNFSLRPFGH